VRFRGARQPAPGAKDLAPMPSASSCCASTRSLPVTPPARSQLLWRVRMQQAWAAACCVARAVQLAFARSSLMCTLDLLSSTHANLWQAHAQSTDDAPVELEDGRWLSRYALPHEEKRVVAYRQRGCCSARLPVGACGAPGALSAPPRGVAADLRDLLHSMGSVLSHSGLLSISGRASSCDSSGAAADGVPALLRELAMLSSALQEKDTRVESRLSLARKQVKVMGRALEQAQVQDEAVEDLLWFVEEKDRLAREASALRAADAKDMSEAAGKMHAETEAAFLECCRTAERLKRAGSVDAALADWLLQGELYPAARPADNVLQLVGKVQAVDALMQHCHACLADDEQGRRKTHSRGSLERRMSGAAAGDAGAAAAGGMVSVVGAAGEDDPDCTSSKRRSVSFDLDNRHEVVMRTISNNVNKAQAKLAKMERSSGLVRKAVRETADRTRRLVSACEHSAAADAILAEEVRHAEEEAKASKLSVDSETKVVDELSHEVTSLSHVCGQQLSKWQDLVTQDLAQGFAAAFPHAARAADASEDAVSSLDFPQAVKVLRHELEEAEESYAAVRQEVARRFEFERTYRQKLRHFVSQMEAAREVEHQHRASFWQRPGVCVCVYVSVCLYLCVCVCRVLAAVYVCLPFMYVCRLCMSAVHVCLPFMYVCRLCMSCRL